MFGHPTHFETRKAVVGMVLDQPFPPDARVEREAVALVEAGYEVHLLCVLPPGETEREFVYRGIQVHRVRPETVTWKIPFLNLHTRLPYRGIIKNLYRTLWNTDTVWLTLIERFVRHYGIQMLHIHDLRLVNTALEVANQFNLPLVADFHENYPALMELMKGRTNGQVDRKKARAQREKWELIERYCALESSHVITVVEEAKERLIRRGIAPQKITVLPNTVDADKFLAAPVDAEATRKLKPRFVLTYVGHINGDHRGLQTVLEAIAQIGRKIPDLHFVAAGSYREPYYIKLTQLADVYGISDKVTFTGSLDETDFATYIQAADICICPHLANDHTNATFPNKLYLYHLFAKPVITSNCEPLARYMEETRGGLVYASGNASELAERILTLYKDANARRRYGEQGQQAVQERYTWKKTSKILVKLYESLASSQTPGVVLSKETKIKAASLPDALPSEGISPSFQAMHPPSAITRQASLEEKPSPIGKI